MKTKLVCLTLILSVLPVTVAQAKNESTSASVTTSTSAPSVNPDSDVGQVLNILKKANGSLDKKKLKIPAKEMVALARKQLNKLTKYALKQIKPKLSKTGSFEPIGVMLYRSGKVNKLELGGKDSQKVPAELRIRLDSLALRSMARHNTIDASVIIFAAKKNKGDKRKMIVMNYEHRFGMSGEKVIPYEFDNGKLKLFKPEYFPKPFFIFYSQNQGRAAQSLNPNAKKQ